jgi:ACS family tartrate transporter-like MFS transporter
MRRLVPFLFLLYVIAYLDRINVVLPPCRCSGSCGFNDATYGLGAAMFFAGYFCFQLPSNLILQSVGARRWISMLMVVWGLISASTAFVTTPRSFYAFRFLLGLAEAGFFPGVMLYLKNWFPAAARARAVSWFMTAAPLSGVIGGPISGAILHLHYGRGLAGWQVLFLAEGLPAVWWGRSCGITLSTILKSASWLSESERAWLVDALERSPGEREQREADRFAVVQEPQSLAPGRRLLWHEHLRLRAQPVAAHPHLQSVPQGHG